MVRVLFAAVVALLAAEASAAPIAYEGILRPGGRVEGQIGPGGPEDPGNARFYELRVGSGASVAVSGRRLEETYDMALWVYRGRIADTSFFGAGFDADGPRAIGFFDDELERPGLFNDPRASSLTEGRYTLAVVDFSSGSPGLDGVYDYRLSVTPVPAALPLMGAALVGLAGLRARQVRRRG